jgi:hypothetical protein
MKKMLTSVAMLILGAYDSVDLKWRPKVGDKLAYSHVVAHMLGETDPPTPYEHKFNLAFSVIEVHDQEAVLKGSFSDHAISLNNSLSGGFDEGYQLPVEFKVTLLGELKFMSGCDDFRDDYFVGTPLRFTQLMRPEHKVEVGESWSKPWSEEKKYSLPAGKTSYVFRGEVEEKGVKCWLVEYNYANNSTADAMICRGKAFLRQSDGALVHQEFRFDNATISDIRNVAGNGTITLAPEFRKGT